MKEIKGLSEVLLPLNIKTIKAIFNGSGVVNPDFQMLIDTTITADSSSTSIIMPMVGTGDIDWGDGNVSVGVTGVQTHDYGVGNGGQYVVKTSNTFSGILHGQDPYDQLKKLEIQNWGTMVWSSANGAFRGCSNMEHTATDYPDISGTNQVTSFFRGCTSITSIPYFDLSGVINTSHAWRECPSLLSFRSDMDFSNVTNTNNMFRGNTGFTTVPLLDLSNVTNPSGMFRDCTGLTSVPLFDFSAGTTCSNIFNGCTGLNGFEMPTFNFASMTNGADMFKSVTMTTSSWSNLLIATEASGNANVGVTWSGGGSMYNASGQTARNLLTGAPRLWTIVDGGLEP